MLKKIISAFAPCLLVCGILACSLIMPKQLGITEARISPDMPLGYTLPGWHGIKTQESELERKTLSYDTRFSKARYSLLPRVPWEQRYPDIHVSIVYSGHDMNNSIHRPEVCLPAQGHLNLQGQPCDIQLNNEKKLTLTRLSSTTPVKDAPQKRIHHIHYYVFVGNDSIHHSHIGRNLQDIADRVIWGRVQAWAYFQAGTWWSPELGISEEDADRRLRKLIAELLPRQIDWEKMK